MSHFAEIDENGVVLRVIVAEQAFIDSGAVGSAKRWVQTSYNTSKGENKTGSAPLRKNFAAPGYKYDKAADAFIPPQPFKSWKLDQASQTWVPPVPYPDKGDTMFLWDEKAQQWSPQ